MNSGTQVLILVVVVLLIIAILTVWTIIRRSCSQKLREKFGPEYKHTLDQAGNRRVAEETLKGREKRVTNLEIRALNDGERNRYRGEWTKTQADFVDNPSKSVEEANRLISDVMIARGIPVSDFEQRAADISVMYPNLVTDYRKAFDIAEKNQRKGASTEDLRQAMVYYHSLYDQLLGTMEVNDAVTEEKKVETNG